MAVGAARKLAAKLSSLKCRVCSHNVAGLISVPGITLPCPWERLAYKRLQVLCVVWKTSTDVRFATAYAEKIRKTNQKQGVMELPVSFKVGLSNNFPLFDVWVYNRVPRVRK